MYKTKYTITTMKKQELPLLNGRKNTVERSGRDNVTQNGTGIGKHNWRRKYKGILLLSLIGWSFIFLALIIYFCDPLEMITRYELTLKRGTIMYKYWETPPLMPYVNIYVFNVTNPEEFLQGKEKLRFEELGPFVYIEHIDNDEAVFNDNNTVTYSLKKRYIPVPSLSSDVLLGASIVVPNIPTIGVASMLADSSTLVNLGFMALTNYLDTKPFLNLTIEEFLWGYKDPIITMASRFAPSVDIDKFAVAEMLFAQDGDVETMFLNDASTTNGESVRPYTIDTYNGQTGLAHWGYIQDDNSTHKICNTLRGVASDGIVYHRNISTADSFYAYRLKFCRTLQSVFDYAGPTESGLPAYWFKFHDDVFDSANPINSCYCQPDEEECLPRGLGDVSPCAYGMPIAMSQPHFYNGDPRLAQAVDGLTPDKLKHDSIVAIQPDFGIPLQIHVKVQINLVVKNTKYNKRVAPFNNLTLPIFWVDISMQELPAFVLMLINLLYFVAPGIQDGVAVLFALLGVTMVILAVVKYSRRRKSGKKWPTS